MSDSTFLKRVEIRNFKSIAHCDVQLGPLNFLVGPNGSGKTNFVDALRFVRDCMTGTFGEATLQQQGVPTRAGASSLSVGLDAGEAGGSYRFELALSYADGAHMISERCDLPGGHFFELRSGELQSSYGQLPAMPRNRPYLTGLSGIPPFDKLYRALASMEFYSPSPSVGVFYRTGSDEALGPTGSNVIRIFDLLDTAAQNDVQDRLRQIAPGIDSVHIEEFSGRRFMRFGVGNTQFLADSMSEGTLRALILLVALAQPKVRNGRIPFICIEEPELGIHPGALAILLGAFMEASETTQVIVTSHSPELLDHKDIPADSLLSVVMDGETRIGPLPEGFREGIRKRLFTPGEILRSTQVDPESTAITADPPPALETPRKRIIKANPRL